MIFPGQRFHNIEVLHVDPTAKRLVVRCCCKTVFQISTQSFQDGIVGSCGCRPLTGKKRMQMQVEASDIRRKSQYARWKPGR